jgi:hypothetical protein
MNNYEKDKNIFYCYTHLFCISYPCKGLLCKRFWSKSRWKNGQYENHTRAIDFVNEKGGGRLVFQVGNYVTGSIYLKSNVTLHLEPSAALLGSTNPLDYVIDPMVKWSSMIFAINQENIGITGKGTINGRGFTTLIISLVNSQRYFRR